MRRRSNLLVPLGVVSLLVGALAVYLLTNDDNSPSTGPAAPVSVVVGTEDIPPGSLADELIKAGKLDTIEVPA
ncbi:MAG: hypothetical protein ABIY48_02600, partial [Acidimicrobiales bacterium]